MSACERVEWLRTHEDAPAEAEAPCLPMSTIFTPYKGHGRTGLPLGSVHVAEDPFEVITMVFDDPSALVVVVCDVPFSAFATCVTILPLPLSMATVTRLPPTCRTNVVNGLNLAKLSPGATWGMLRATGCTEDD